MNIFRFKFHKLRDDGGSGDSGSSGSGDSGSSQSDSAGFGPPASAAPAGPPASAAPSGPAGTSQSDSAGYGPPASAISMGPPNPNTGFSLSGVLDGMKTAAYNVGQIGILATPGVGPFVAASKIGALSSIGTSIGNFFSGVNTNYGGTFGGSTVSNNSNGFSDGLYRGSSGSAFSLSSPYAPSVNSSIASAGGSVVSGVGSPVYSPALDSLVTTAKNTALTNTGGSLQAVAPTQSKGDSTSLLATLAALASIFAVFKA